MPSCSVRERERGLDDGGEPDPAAQPLAAHLVGLRGVDQSGYVLEPDPPVQQAGRNDEDVGGEPVAADVRRLPDLAGKQLGERLDRRPPADRAARRRAPVRAHEERGRGVRDAGGPVERDVEQIGVAPIASPSAATRVRSGSRPDPTGARATPGSRPGRRITCTRTPAAPARGRAARARRGGRNRTRVSPSGPHGPGCSTSRIRLAGNAVPEHRVAAKICAQRAPVRRLLGSRPRRGVTAAHER